VRERPSAKVRVRVRARVWVWVSAGLLRRVELAQVVPG